MTTEPNSEEWQGFWIGQSPTANLYVRHLSTAAQGEHWQRFLVAAAAPGFRARFECDAQLREFAAFGSQVRSMHETLKGTVHLELIEGNVDVDARIDHPGHVFWSVKLRSGDFDSAPQLNFDIEEDQTMLWNVCAKIEDMLGALGGSEEA